MNNLQELLLSGLAGVVSGFLVSVPVGPTNLAIINEGARRGFIYALLIGLGSMTMEVIYCSIAFASFSGMFESRVWRSVMELISFLLVSFLGIKYLFARALPATPHSVDVLENRFHPHTAFMTGFVRVLGNPSVLLFWITLSAMFIAHRWVEPTWASKSACVAGVAVGACAWFGLLSWGVSFGHRKFSPKTLLRMSQVSGACLLIAAIVIGTRLVKLLANR
ncbi:MAG: LysE family transporter [Rhodobacteraceae bacterium]|nr:LysE family transporter [Paracoccaceae bacterium]